VRALGPDAHVRPLSPYVSCSSGKAGNAWPSPRNRQRNRPLSCAMFLGEREGDGVSIPGPAAVGALPLGADDTLNKHNERTILAPPNRPRFERHSLSPRLRRDRPGSTARSGAGRGRRGARRCSILDRRSPGAPSDHRNRRSRSERFRRRSAQGSCMPATSLSTGVYIKLLRSAGRPSSTPEQTRRLEVRHRKIDRAGRPPWKPGLRPSCSRPTTIVRFSRTVTTHRRSR
jgi:hypothetical protein